jgi:cell division protein FtsB
VSDVTSPKSRPTIEELQRTIQGQEKEIHELKQRLKQKEEEIEKWKQQKE